MTITEKVIAALKTVAQKMTDDRQEVSDTLPKIWNHKISVFHEGAAHVPDQGEVLYESYPLDDYNHISNYEDLDLKAQQQKALEIAREVLPDAEVAGTDGAFELYEYWFATEDGEFRFRFEPIEVDLYEEWNDWSHDKDNKLFGKEGPVDISDTPPQPKAGKTVKNEDFELPRAGSITIN